MTPLQDQRAVEIARRGLMAFPEDGPDDALRIEGIEAVLACVHAPLQLRLPKCGLLIEIPPFVPPSLVYYLALGDYEQSDIDIALKHVRRGDRVLEIGAGIGNLTSQFIPREFYVASDINPHYLRYLRSYATASRS